MLDLLTHFLGQSLIYLTHSFCFRRSCSFSLSLSLSLLLSLSLCHSSLFHGSQPPVSFTIYLILSFVPLSCLLYISSIFTFSQDFLPFRPLSTLHHLPFGINLLHHLSLCGSICYLYFALNLVHYLSLFLVIAATNTDILL